ncbi:MAG: hypothetical protein ACOYWZ_00080 [Bacillota bacterium]
MAIGRKVTIAGVVVTGHVKRGTVHQNAGEAITTCELVASKTITDVLTLNNGQTVIMWRNLNGIDENDIIEPNHRIFKGYIETYVTEGGIITIMCRDQLGLAMRKTYTRIFLNTEAEAGVLSKIFKTLLTQAGLSYDDTTIQDSGTILILNRFRCVNSYIFERLQKLAEILDWQFYYRADTDKVYFEPEGYVTNPNTIGTDNILQKIKWEYDTKDMINDLTIIGAKQLVTKNPSEVFTGNGTQKIWVLAATPENIKVTTGTSAKKCGIKGSGVGLDVYVDKQTKTIEFVVAPPNGTQISVGYDYTAPVPIHSIRQTSIDTYGKYQKEMTLMDVINIDDAINRGNKILDKYCEPFKYATIKINMHNLYSLKIGNRIRVDDDVNDVDAVFVVQKYIQNYPMSYDEIQVGEKEKDLSRFIAALSDKTKRIEEEEYRDTELIINLVQSLAAFEIKPKQMNITQTAINDSFIIGHTTHGIIGTSMLGDRKTLIGTTTYNY